MFGGFTFCRQDITLCKLIAYVKISKENNSMEV